MYYNRKLEIKIEVDKIDDALRYKVLREVKDYIKHIVKKKIWFRTFNLTNEVYVTRNKKEEDNETGK